MSRLLTQTDLLTIPKIQEEFAKFGLQFTHNLLHIFHYKKAISNEYFLLAEAEIC